MFQYLMKMRLRKSLAALYNGHCLCLFQNLEKRLIQQDVSTTKFLKQPSTALINELL